MVSDGTQSDTGQSCWALRGPFPMSFANSPKRTCRPLQPVISTMLRLFARRQRASVSAYFTNSLTPPIGLGLLASPRGGDHLDRAARGSVAPRKMACRPAAGDGTARFKAINSRTEERGSSGRCPFLIGSRNGRQVARPRFALLPVAVLRSLRLGGGSRHFWLGVFCPRYSRDARRGLWAAALTWTS